jgi:hypothetical protein
MSGNNRNVIQTGKDIFFFDYSNPQSRIHNSPPMDRIQSDLKAAQPLTTYLFNIYF